MNVAATRKARIDQMLKDGKITPEQHEELLGSLEEDDRAEAAAGGGRTSGTGQPRRASALKRLDLTPGRFLLCGVIGIFLLVVALIVSSLIFPQFEMLYAESEVEIPFLTQMVFVFGQAFRHYGLLMAPILLPAVAGFWGLDILRNRNSQWKGWRGLLVGIILLVVIGIPVFIGVAYFTVTLPLRALSRGVGL